ncbi:alpha/beta fold hydrolase [Vallitalea okinawensis]|uniref:alpha/beta fold hydrolase n=1 Tax=Vallitalea okinawensis TaxID=2078660 RepID=UPI000CFA9095|nr:alpha/beta hydrolase [Vallitalea okinawensis]
MRYEKWFHMMKEQAYKDAQYLHTERGSIHYTDIGKGPVILHSHGSPAGADIGPVFLKDFTQQGYRVVTPSRPGFLGTDLALGKSIEEQADFFKNFLDKLKIKKVFVHAWSAGGPPAIAFALKYPEYVNGLILFCAVSHRWVHKITKFEKMMLSNRGIWMLWNMSRVFKSSFRKKSAEELGVDYNYVKENDERLALLDNFFEMTAPPSLRNIGSFNDIKNYSEMKEFDFSNVKVPTLILFSPSDNQIPVSNGDLPAEGIKGAEYIRFTHGGHMPMIDREAELVNRKMLKFMEENNGSI